MVGGSDADIARAMPIFDTLRPGPGRRRIRHVGPVGAGHSAKMVHNGIEYALMTATPKVTRLLAAEDVGEGSRRRCTRRGRTARWCGPGCSTLLAKALKEDPGLNDISGYTEDSGEGRWTVEEAIRLRVPVPGIAAACSPDSFPAKMIRRR